MSFPCLLKKLKCAYFEQRKTNLEEYTSSILLPVAACMGVRAHFHNPMMVVVALGKPLWSLSNTAAPAGVCDACGSGELYLSLAALVGHQAEEPPPSERRPRRTKLTRFNERLINQLRRARRPAEDGGGSRDCVLCPW